MLVTANQKEDKKGGQIRLRRAMGNSNRLSATFVKGVKTPGRYRDGGGLLLFVEPSGSKRWVLRITTKGKRHDIGLGSASVVGLAEAREEARLRRKDAQKGTDPLAARRRAKRGVITFAEAAETAHQQRLASWANGKHAAQWITTLRTYAGAIFGAKPVADIDAADVQRALLPIWIAKPETARRVRQRIGVVLDWAVVSGHRDPSRANAAKQVGIGLPRQPRRDHHHPAIPWQDVPAFIRTIRETPSIEAVRLALEFLTLTATRTSETLSASWIEFDLEAEIWTIPAKRMGKTRRTHRVPLARPALRILKEARTLWPTSELIFPGAKHGRPLSNMALTMLMRRLDRVEVPHGFRSSFRDWAADNGKDRDAAEAALAHTIKSKVEGAYRRTDFFEIRKLLMAEWADFVCESGEHAK